MKFAMNGRPLLFLCSWTLVLLSACKKEQPFSAYKSDFKHGITTAKINGVDFSGQTAIAGDDSSFSGMGIAKVKFNGNIEIPIWAFTIVKIKKLLGKQRLYQPNFSDWEKSPPYATLTHYDGGWDASCGDYQTIDADSNSNYIEITDQKDNYHEIWGRFNVTLYIATQCRYNPMPDTIRFTEGNFHLFPPDKK